LVETWKQTMTSPERFWSSVKPDGRWEDALLYAWVLGAISLVVGAILKLPFQGLIADQVRRSLDMARSMGNIPPEAQRLLEAFLGARVGFQLWGVVVQLILFPVILLIHAALVHLFCILFGCATNGFWATFRALSYAQAPIVFVALQAVPCLGTVLTVAASVYIIVLQIWGIMRLQETSGGKAAAAVLAIFVIACCCVCGVGIFAAGALKSVLSSGS
jgi:hypothetical protein